MTIKTRWSIKSKRMQVGVIALALLLSTIIVFGVGHKQSSQPEPITKSPPVLTAPAVSKTLPPPANAPAPQDSAQFDIPQSVIAGGGGASSADNFTLEGSIGQATAGTVI